MTLQVLKDCTINGPFGFRIVGPGEILTLPGHQAVQVVNLEPEAFRIMSPTPLIPGVVVRWLLHDDTAQGPGSVHLVDGTQPDRRVSVQTGAALRWIHERDITDIDPWPAIAAKMEEATEHVLREGIECPQVLAIHEWVHTHFGEEKA